MTDCELADSLLRKDSSALEALAEWHYDSIYRFLRHLTRHRETAEDLAQQTLFKASDKIGSFRGDSSLKTWIHRIALHEYSGWKRRQRVLLPLGMLKGSVEPAFELIDEAEALLDVLESLPAAYREALLLFHVQELSIEEIAVVTGSPVGTVKSRLHHARKQMRAESEPSPEELCYEK